jgi:hypothetical protein
VKNLYRKLIEEEASIYIVTFFCDFLLSEIGQTENDEIVEEINQLIQKLIEFAKIQKSNYIVIQAHLFQGILALFQKNLREAGIWLTRAQNMAEEHGLQRHRTQHLNIVEN